MGEVVAVAVPPTDVGLTVTVATLELAGEQTPLVTTARKHVVLLKLPVLRVAAVWPVMLVNGPPLLADDCHWIVPV